MENEEERDRADDDVSLGNLSALFESFQGRVVVELARYRVSMRLENESRDCDMANYLLIELVNVVVGLPLGLDVHGVVLNTLSCGHD